jgi:amino acid adenylation domain-containing protein/non-ribosomal peptide synthase protein (TIGR01720 family)
MVLGEQELTGLEELGRRSGSSLFMVLLSTVNALLYRYTGQQDIVTGSPVAGRGHKDLEDQVGFYVNTLALRNRVEGEKGFMNLLESVKGVTLSGYDHQWYPFDLLVDELGLARDMSRSPLFDVMVVLQSQGDGSAAANPGSGLGGGIEISGYGEGGEAGISKFDLSFYFKQQGKELSLVVEYSTDIFERERIERLLEHYRILTESIIKNPELNINALEYMSAAEVQEVTELFNATAYPYDCEATVVSLFEEQVLRTPGKTAVLSGDEILSYTELNERSNIVAHYLREIGVAEGSLVGICMSRGTGLVTGLLGILKAGGAYVPVDGNYPADRIGYMISDTQMQVILTDESAAGLFSDYEDLHVIKIAEAIFNKRNKKEKLSNPGIAFHAGSLAYIIYTSGSTGRPKGVMIEHGNTSAFLQWCAGEFGSSEFEVVYAVTSVSFDLSVFELFYPLSCGKGVRVLENGLSIGEALLSETVPGGVLVNTVPGVIGQLLRSGSELDGATVINMAGEPVPVEVQSGLDKLGREVRNLYGPTETTTYSTVYRMHPGETLLIGRPVGNTQVYVLDENKRLLPVGVAGELYIGGAGVSRGYLKKEELTAERFIANPYGEGRLYRTGDRGRWSGDGNLEYLGRLDDQVKIRGFRIEPGEVEHVLQAAPGVQQGVVVCPQEKDGQRRLVGYVVKGAGYDREEVLGYMKERLPDYMVPSLLSELAELPVNSNGKVDRKQLLAMDLPSVSTKYEAPRSDVERELVRIWEEVLGHEGIGIHDNFFELGGHSLRAMRIVSQLSRDLGIKGELRWLFLHPTIAELSAVVTNAESETYRGIEHIADQSDYALSHAQRRLWILSELEDGIAAYNVPGAYHLKGPVDRESFERSFLSLVDRHEILRTGIVMVEGEPRQRVYSLSESGYGMRYMDLRDKENRYAVCAELASLEAGYKFPAAARTMLRSVLVRLEEEEYVFLLTLHHIITDEWSMSVLLKEALQLYSWYSKKEEKQLTPLKIQYRDYAHWQLSELSGAGSEASRSYWLEQFSKDIPQLELPSDRVRPVVKSYRGSTAGVLLGEAELAKLEELGRGCGASLFMVLLSTVNALLYRYTGQEDIVTGSPVAGRGHKDLEDQVGFYINTLALRNRFSGEWSFNKLMHSVRDTTLLAYEHQWYPFDLLVDELGLARDMSRSPLFDVMVVLQSQGDGSAAANPGSGLGGGIEISGYGEGGEAGISKFDISFYFSRQGKELQLVVEYSTDIFDRERIERLGEHYRTLVESIVKNPDININALEYMSSAEISEVTELFNATAYDYDSNATVVSLFESQVLRTPGKTAVLSGDEVLSYGELNERSNTVAYYLREAGVGTGSLVGICMKRGAGLVTGLLGILKAGGAYVPVDGNYPADRIGYMIGDTQMEVMLTDSEHEELFTGYEGLRVIRTEDAEDFFNKTNNKEKLSNPCIELHAGSLAYIIYTSGSTGRPKGVMIEHGNTSAFLQWCAGEFGSSEFEVVYAVTSVSFDLSVFELFYPLTCGKGVRVLENGLSIGEALSKETAEGGILLNTVPGVIGQLLRDGSELKGATVINMAGEPVPVEVQHGLEKLDKEVRNLYGPTETTTYSTVYRMYAGRPLLIGVPVGNTQVYVLDENKRLLPVGVAGELYIGGAGVSRGYLNREELTAERFITNPYGEGRLYRTGDRGRWLRDGNLEYLGRSDDQVKIRGFRIEPGEVEHVLQGAPGVQQGVVVCPQDSDGQRRLVGYVVKGAGYDREEVLGYMKERLPDYMIPSLLSELAELPVNSNGKVDRKQLLAMELPGVSSEYTAPRSEIERELVRIWEEVLGREGIGIHDNFFELGGDSITLIQIVNRVKLKQLQLEVRDMLLKKTIASVSPFVRKLVQKNGEQGMLKGNSPLLPIQSWFFEQQHKDISHFNQSVLLEIDKDVSEKSINESLQALLIHHDALRFCYSESQEGWMQEYGNESCYLIEENLATSAQEDIEGKITALCEQYQQSLDIYTGKLLKMVLIRTPVNEKNNRLFIVIHHLAVDGVSWRILLENLESCIDALATGKSIGQGMKTSSYREWCKELEIFAQSETAESQLPFWEKVVRNVPVLPADYPSQLSCWKDVNEYTASLSAIHTKSLLQETNRAYKTEINDILLTALAQTIGEWCNNEKILIGLEGHGREDISMAADVTETIGWFTNLYPVLLELNRDMNPGSMIKSVKEQLRQIPGKGMAYGALKYLHPSEEIRKRLKSNGVFDIVFNYLGQLDNIAGLNKKITLAPEEHGSDIGPDNHFNEKFMIDCSVSNGALSFLWRYSSRQYKPATISDLAEKFIENLTLLINHCSYRKETEHTPSDFGLNGSVSYQELDDFMQTGQNDQEDILII